jgi:protein-tyrosine sulfotransferase
MTSLSDTHSPLIFVLSTGRSGSTLLRLVLDAHPDVACPPELNLSTVFGAIEFTAQSAFADDPDAAWRVTKTLAEQVVQSTLASYAGRTSKARCCDKSLPSLEYRELLLRLFPDAQFICLYRGCKDTIASLLEASPYGFSAFGLEPYVRAHPDNLVLACARYWVEKTELGLEFEQNHKDQVHRLTYEEMVGNPHRSFESLAKFLRISWHPEYIDEQRIFTNELSNVPGDYKIRYKTTFDTSSVGRGWSIPDDLIPISLRGRLDAINKSLGYPDITSRPNGQTEEDRDKKSRDDLIPSMHTLMATRVATRLATARNTVREELQTIKLALVDEPAPWLIDFVHSRAHQGDGFATCVIVSDTPTILGMANGTCNPGVALRQSKIRVGFDPRHAKNNGSPDAFLRAVDALVSLVG